MRGRHRSAVSGEVANCAIMGSRQIARDILRRMAGRWPFVGRAHELARAEALLAAGVGVLVVGDPGVGKSEFARELGLRSASAGAATAHVVGHAVSSGTPFEAFSGVLFEQSGSGGSQLAVADVVARVSTTLPIRSGRRPLLVVDDVQLIDTSSAQVLLRIADAGLATIVATAPANEPLESAVNQLWRKGLCERIELVPLIAEEVGELLEVVLEGLVDSGVVRAFAERSGGNALFLRELVGASLDKSLLVRRGTGGGQRWTLTADPPVSSGIREAVAARLAGLSDVHRAALELVAAGEPLAAAAAADLVGDLVLDQLAADRLVVVRDGLAGPEVATAHPIHGDVLRTDMPGLRLRRLRLALAHRLETGDHVSPHDLVRAAVWRLDSGQAGDPDQLVAAARAARWISLETAERLARHAYEASGSLPAALLLAEILTHTGRTADAAELTARLPPDSLSPADREAIVYCAAMGEGLLRGDPGGGADLVGGVLAGVDAASDQLRALQSALLAFDARFDAALDVALPIVENPAAAPAARTLAAIGAVGAAYWLGRHRRAVALADRIEPVAIATRDALPFGWPSIELIAIGALAEQGDLDAAERRAEQLRRRADADHDTFAGPRADYCLARVALLRGQAATAQRLLAGCLADLSSFDQFIARHLGAVLARAAVARGDVEAARAALVAAADKTRMKTYEPEDELAEAALLAASLRMDDAVERAAWAAGIAAANAEWNVALIAYHDAARYGGARQVVVAMREAVAHVDGTLAWCYLDHVIALAARDGAGLDEVARRFEAHGALLFAAEAESEAALAHAAAAHTRPARASSARAVELWAPCEAVPPPWLAGSAAAAPLTGRERQVAALAVAGLSDAAIATRLRISIRTVQTHLGHVYDKVGSVGRADLAVRLAVSDSGRRARGSSS